MKKTNCGYLGKDHIGRENSQCKGPGVETFLMCLTNSQEASMAGTKRAKGEWEGKRSERWSETGSCRALSATARTLGVILNEMSNHCRVLNRNISDNICPIGGVFVRRK